MKSLKLIGLALGASLGAVDNGAGAGHLHRGGRPDDGRRIRIRPADEERRRTGGRRHQCRRRRARQEAQAGGRRRCLRSQAGALGRRKVRQRPKLPFRRRALLLVVVDPGVGGLCRRQRTADHAGLDQPDVHRAQAVEPWPRLRPRRSAGPGRRPITSSKNYKGKNVAILNDKTTYGKGLADETKKALNKAGSPRRCTRLQQGRQGFSRDRRG